MRFFLVKSAIASLLTIGTVAILSGCAAGATDLQHVLNNLRSRNYNVLAWRIFPDDRTALLLLYRESPGFRRYYAYAEVDDNGTFLVEPDSISGSQMMSVNGTFFDGGGKLYMYDNRGGEQQSPLQRFSFDPRSGATEYKEYESWQEGHLYGGSYISGIGNVLFTIVYGSKIPYRLIIEDPEAKSQDVSSLAFIDNYLYPWVGICAHRLSKDMILIVGTTSYAPDGINTIWLVSDFVYDLEERRIAFHQDLPYDSLISAGAPEMESNGPAQLFEKDGRLFYLAVGEPIKSRVGKEEHRTLVVPIGPGGEITSETQSLQMSIEYESLVSVPEEFILLRDTGLQSGKLWILSLDDFPTLVIDKGE
jgi:hypothetical protein